MQGVAALNKVTDTTLQMKFVDAIRYFEAAADTYVTIGKCEGGVSCALCSSILGPIQPAHHVCFLIATAGRRSGESYLHCYEAQLRLGDRLAAATYASDAARAYGKVDPGAAIRARLKAITQLAGTGRLAAAASE